MQEFKHIPVITQEVSKIRKSFLQILVYAEYTCKYSPWVIHHTSGGSSSTDFITEDNYPFLLQEASNSAWAKIGTDDGKCSPDSFEITDTFIRKLVEQLQGIDDYIYSNTTYNQYKNESGKKFDNHNDYYYIQKIVNNQIHITKQNRRRLKIVVDKYNPAMSRMTYEANTYRQYTKIKEKIKKE